MDYTILRTDNKKITTAYLAKGLVGEPINNVVVEKGIYYNIDGYGIFISKRGCMLVLGDGRWWNIMRDYGMKERESLEECLKNLLDYKTKLWRGWGRENRLHELYSCFDECTSDLLEGTGKVVPLSSVLDELFYKPIEIKGDDMLSGLMELVSEVSHHAVLVDTGSIEPEQRLIIWEENGVKKVATHGNLWRGK